LASKRPADVQYEVTLEGGKDEDDHHHPSLRKYEFDARNMQVPYLVLPLNQHSDELD